MKQWLIKRIKKLFENIESTVTTLIVLTLLSGSIGILALSKKALIFFLQIANIPTPLWVSIAMVVLCYGYIYLKAKKIHSLQNLQNTTYIEKISELEKQIEIQNLDLMANIIEKNLEQDNAIKELNRQIEILFNPPKLDDELNKLIEKLNKPNK